MKSNLAASTLAILSIVASTNCAALRDSAPEPTLVVISTTSAADGQSQCAAAAAAIGGTTLCAISINNGPVQYVQLRGVNFPG